MGFWQGKRVFITGHTGFKGSWLTAWLHGLGAEVTGYALPASADPSRAPLHPEAGGGSRYVSIAGDIRDETFLAASMRRADPQIVFHLAAQPLVRASYRAPAATFAVNAAGTANLLQAVQGCRQTRAVVVVTSDKVYDNREWDRPYRENDMLGGRDPYSASKACAELVTASFRRSFFDGTAVAVATARSGNTIGGGDWAEERLVPDLIRGLLGGRPPVLRNPESVRPWQHVLDALAGYLLLAERLYSNGGSFAGPWNFGPDRSQRMTARELARLIRTAWTMADGSIEPAALREDHAAGAWAPHEARTLALDSAKAQAQLGWKPRLPVTLAARWTVDWYRAVAGGARADEVTLDQIARYRQLAAANDTEGAKPDEDDAIAPA